MAEVSLLRASVAAAVAPAHVKPAVRWLPRVSLTPSTLTATVLWGLGLALAAGQTWAAIRSQSMNADGIAYLDVADAYLRRDWAAAINPVWGPLYSWLLAVALHAFRHLLSEPVLVHLTNLAIFVFAFACFTFLQRELAHWRRKSIEPGGAVPEWAYQIVGYLLFLWSMLCLVSIWAVTPDMLMASLVCLAGALIVRIRRSGGRAHTFAILGLILGAAYLTKSIMFPLGFAFLGAAAIAARGTRSRATLGAAVFLVVSAPWVAAISAQHGRVTFGEAGRLTYLRYVNGMPYPYWYGETTAFGRPVHPTRLVLADPPVHEFGSPVAGTYLISYNPAYWYQGAELHLSVNGQLSAVLRSVLFYYDLFARDLGAPLACLALMYLLARRRRSGMRERLRRWTLFLPAAAALALYALVYVEGRYVGIFVLLIFMDAVSNIRPRPSSSPRWMAASFAIMCAFIAANLFVFHVRGYFAVGVSSPATGETNVGFRADPMSLADAVRGLGVPEGAGVGIIGYSFDSYWARLARVRIVAELPDASADRLWRGGELVEQAVIRAFGQAGAQAIIIEYLPPSVPLSGFQRVGNSQSYIKRLTAHAAPSDCVVHSPDERCTGL